MSAAQRREIEQLARLAADPEACIVELRRRVEALEIARALAQPDCGMPYFCHRGQAPHSAAQGLR